MKFLKFGNSKKFIVFLHGWGADKNSFLWLKNYFLDYEKSSANAEPHVNDYAKELPRLAR